MLKLSVFEFVFRAMPESFIYMFAIYSFSKTIVDKKKYLLSAFLMVICVFVSYKNASNKLRSTYNSKYYYGNSYNLYS